jgi:hypothetical protein
MVARALWGHHKERYREDMEKKSNQLQKQWKQIRGDFKWFFLEPAAKSIWTHVAGGGTLLMTTIAAAYAYIGSLSGPAFFQFVFAAFAFYIVILAFGLVIANQIQQWWVFRRWERGELPPPPLSPAPHDAQPATEAWLTEIAEEELRNDTGVIVVHHYATLRTVNPSAPYIEFT